MSTARLIPLVLTTLVAAGCQTETPSEPPEAAVPPAPPPPRLVVASSVVDLGSVPQTEKSSGRMTFTNQGGSALVIEKIDTSCGCTAITLERKRYDPGETGTLHIEFDPKAPGQQKKMVTIISNDPAGPVAIEVHADVRPFIAMEPPELGLGVRAYGESHVVDVEVTSLAPDFRIDSVSASNRHVTAEVIGKPGKPGEPWIVRVTVSPDAPWGGLFSYLSVTGTGQPEDASAPIQHTMRIRVEGQLFGHLHADPDIFRFGVKKGEQFTRRIEITRPDGQPLNLIETKVVARCLEDSVVEIERTSPTTMTLTLTATAGRLAGRCLGELQVTTDTPGETLLRLPIDGMVRP